MVQHCVAGLVVTLIGAVLLLWPHRMWQWTESWKKALRLPEATFAVIARIVGAVMLVTGVLVFFLGH